MPARIDLPLLSPADALDLAVLIGEEARQRNLDFAELAAVPAEEPVRRDHIADDPMGQD